MSLHVASFAGQPLGQATFENLDHLLQLEMRPYGQTQGVVPHLYDLARPAGAAPLTEQAARELVRRRGEPVLILTGLQIPGHMPFGETDGPLGALILARALEYLGHPVTIVCEPEIVPVVRGLAETLGTRTTVRPSDEEQSPDDVRRAVAEFGIGIAIEKLGHNADGVRHTVGGNAVTTGDQWAEARIVEIRRAGGFTIGIGDNGNEIGFGKIASLIRGLVPRGEVPRSGSSDGIVTVCGTDLLVPCAVSNYGGYGIAAALACLTERTDLLASADEVEAMLRRALELGCVNGGLEEQGFVGDDGVPLDAVRAYVTLVATVAAQYFVRVGDHN